MSTVEAPLEFVFKEIDNLEITLDVYLPPQATAENPASVLVWWHGGGLFQGTRKGFPPHFPLMTLSKNIAFISADYRFAPQTPLPCILEDCVSAISFVRDSLPALVEHKINPSKLAVSGGSAGGWLALLAGVPGSFGAIDPPPSCIVAMYPITDVETPFYTVPQHPVPYWPAGMIDASAAAPHTDPSSPAISNSSLTGPRAIVYHHTLQEALWSRLWFANPCPAGTPSTPEGYSMTPRIALAREKGFAIPPTFVTMGSVDNKVDPAGPALVVEQLREAGGVVVFSEREGKDHLFDMAPTEGMEELHKFIDLHLL